jgi:hypothetical protein
MNENQQDEGFENKIRVKKIKRPKQILITHLREQGVTMKNQYKKIILPVYLLIMTLLFCSAVPQFETNASTSKIGLAKMNVLLKKATSGTSAVAGTLKKGQRVLVFSSSKEGWMEIRGINKQKAYIQSKYIDFTLPPSKGEVQKILSERMMLQQETWKKKQTKNEIYQNLSFGYTKEFIEDYIKEDMETSGRNKSGQQRYHVKASDYGQKILWPFQWKKENRQELPEIDFSHKGSKQLLIISQYQINEEAGDHWRFLFLEKDSANSNWKIYQYKEIY